MSLLAEGLHIGIIGDYNPAKETHRLTDEAFSSLPGRPRFTWIATDEVPDADRLLLLDGLLIAPSSPYKDMGGALRAIRTAREQGLPLLGT